MFLKRWKRCWTTESNRKTFPISSGKLRFANSGRWRPKGNHRGPINSALANQTSALQMTGYLHNLNLKYKKKKIQHLMIMLFCCKWKITVGNHHQTTDTAEGTIRNSLTFSRPIKSSVQLKRTSFRRTNRTTDTLTVLIRIVNEGTAFTVKHLLPNTNTRTITTDRSTFVKCCVKPTTHRPLLCVKWRAVHLTSHRPNYYLFHCPRPHLSLVNLASGEGCRCPILSNS